MLERDIESAVVKYAKTLGIISYKFTSPSRAAVPDRIFISQDGSIVFVEFKRAGLKPTVAQEREHNNLRTQGCYVTVVDSVTLGKSVIDGMIVS